jgi:hypothetical protein
VEDFSKISFWWKIFIYIMIGVGVLIFLLIRACWAGYMVGRSQLKIHKELLDHVFHAPPSLLFVIHIV